MAIDLHNPIHLALIAYSIGVAGMVSHYLKRWLRKEIEGSLIDYLYRDHPRETALALFALGGAVGTAVFSGQFDGMSLKQLVLPTFLLGYACDSGVNKGAQPSPAK